jgi:hypothetical protein
MTNLSSRIKKLEMSVRQSEDDYLCIIRSYGTDPVREREEGESMKDYLAFLDSMGVRYVYIPSLTG